MDKEERDVLFVERVLDVPVRKDQVAVFLAAAGPEFLRQHLQTLRWVLVLVDVLNHGKVTSAALAILYCS